MSIDGDLAIVGARGDDGAGDHSDRSGSAYVFKRTGTTWSQEAKLTAIAGAAEDVFGLSVSIDGDLAIVGAFGDDDAGGHSGSAYVYDLRRCLPPGIVQARPPTRPGPC